MRFIRLLIVLGLLLSGISSAHAAVVDMAGCGKTGMMACKHCCDTGDKQAPKNTCPHCLSCGAVAPMLLPVPALPVFFSRALPASDAPQDAARSAQYSLLRPPIAFV